MMNTYGCARHCSMSERSIVWSAGAAITCRFSCAAMELFPTFAPTRTSPFGVVTLTASAAAKKHGSELGLVANILRRAANETVSSAKVKQFTG